MEALRQLYRYAGTGHFDDLILLTTVPLDIPDTLTTAAGTTNITTVFLWSL